MTHNRFPRLYDDYGRPIQVQPTIKITDEEKTERAAIFVYTWLKPKKVVAYVLVIIGLVIAAIKR